MNTKKIPDKNHELLKVLNSDGEWTGLLETRDNVHLKKLHYNSVSLVIYCKEDDSVLLEQRSFNKVKNPGKWALVGGHVIEDEELMETAINEAREEIGVDFSNMKVKYLTTLLPTETNSGFNHIFYVKLNKKNLKFKLQKEEVEAVKWFEYRKWKKAIKEGSRKFSGNYKRYKPFFLVFETKLGL